MVKTDVIYRFQNCRNKISPSHIIQKLSKWEVKEFKKLTTQSYQGHTLSFQNLHIKHSTDFDSRSGSGIAKLKTEATLLKSVRLPFQIKFS